MNTESNPYSISLAMILVLSLAFFSCTPKEASQTVKCNYPVERPSTSSITATKGAIYLDLSTSMQGYISDPSHNMPFTLLQHLLHRVLITSFHHVNISKPTFYGFNRDIITEMAPLVHYALTSNDGTSPRTRFNKAETNIIGVLLEVAKKADLLSVIVTDGLQDVHGINSMLAPGFDLPEFTSAICEGLIDQGVGIWLLGVMNDFDGYYYNIIPNWQGQINKPVYIKSERPFYCWIVCRDILKGRQFVSYLFETVGAIAHDSGNNEIDKVKCIELSPGIYPTVSVCDPSNVEIDKNNLEIIRNLTRVRDWQTDPEYTSTKIVTVDFPESTAGSVYYILKVKISYSQDANYLWNNLSPSVWKIEIDEPNNFPLYMLKEPLQYSKSQTQDFRVIGLRIPFDRLNGLSAIKRKIELPIYIHADLQNGLKDQWVEHWSTSNDNELKYIDKKTLYFYEMTKEVLQNTIGKRKAGACLHLSLIKR
jgi:hypothetical protein